MRVAIDARLTSRAPGGVWQVVVGLAHGFSQLLDGDERYCFLVHESYDGGLDGYLGDNCEIVRMGPSERGFGVWRTLSRRAQAWWPRVPKSDGMLEQQSVDGVHFLLPIGFRTNVPCVYQIHDLQHLHFPEYFRTSTRRLRRIVFPEMCRQASRVFTMTNWGKQDAVEKLDLPPDKVTVVPWGSVLSAYGEPSRATVHRLQTDLGVGGPFAYFPAKAYPHKNHVRLLQAVARLRDEFHVRIPLILSGAEGAATPSIICEIERLGLADQVRHVGYVAPAVVSALFRCCRCLVFPSLFEGWGLPVTEALSLRKPIVCARATCLPEVAQDAAAYFDPDDVESIARGLLRVWTDNEYRAGLQDRAASVAAELTWQNTARQFRTHYRQLFGQPKVARKAA
jgi:glycosyltransferase involved in cell wall biosynthesis